MGPSLRAQPPGIFHAMHTAPGPGMFSSYCPRPSDLSPVPSHSRMSSLRLSQWLPSSSSRSPAPLLREPLLTLVPSRGPVPGEGSAWRVSVGWMNGAHTLSCQLLPAPLQWSVRTAEPSRHVRPFRAGPCLPALLSSVSQGLRPCPLLPTLGAGPPPLSGGHLLGQPGPISAHTLSSVQCPGRVGAICSLLTFCHV